MHAPMPHLLKFTAFKVTPIFCRILFEPVEITMRKEWPSQLIGNSQVCNKFGFL